MLLRYRHYYRSSRREKFPISKPGLLTRLPVGVPVGVGVDVGVFVGVGVGVGVRVGVGVPGEVGMGVGEVVPPLNWLKMAL